MVGGKRGWGVWKVAAMLLLALWLGNLGDLGDCECRTQLWNLPKSRALKSRFCISAREGVKADFWYNQFMFVTFCHFGFFSLRYGVEEVVGCACAWRHPFLVDSYLGSLEFLTLLRHSVWMGIFASLSGGRRIIPWPLFWFICELWSAQGSDVVSVFKRSDVLYLCLCISQFSHGPNWTNLSVHCGWIIRNTWPTSVGVGRYQQSGVWANALWHLWHCGCHDRCWCICLDGTCFDSGVLGPNVQVRYGDDIGELYGGWIGCNASLTLSTLSFGHVTAGHFHSVCFTLFCAQCSHHIQLDWPKYAKAPLKEWGRVQSVQSVQSPRWDQSERSALARPASHGPMSKFWICLRLRDVRHPGNAAMEWNVMECVQYTECLG